MNYIMKRIVSVLLITVLTSLFFVGCSSNESESQLPNPGNGDLNETFVDPDTASNTTQVDLPNNSQSGLKIVQDVLTGVEDISFMYLNAEDVVRNRLVGDIVTAYGNWDQNISKSTFPIRSGKGDR